MRPARTRCAPSSSTTSGCGSGTTTSMGRRACLIAESDLNDPRVIRDVSAGGYGLDAQWLDDFRHALHVTLTGEADVCSAQYQGLADVAYSLSRGYVFDW